MSGEDVKSLQSVIGGLVVDGSFGPATDKRVREYQKSKGLAVDGSVGPITQKALGLTSTPTTTSNKWRVDIYDKKNVWFAGTPYGANVKPLKTLKTWAKEEGADIVFNLAHYNMGPKISLEELTTRTEW